MNLSNLSLDTLKRAVTIKEEINRLNGELASVLDGNPEKEIEPTARVTSPKPGRRKMSAAGRAKIAAAARKRWAKARAAGRNTL